MSMLLSQGCGEGGTPHQHIPTGTNIIGHIYPLDNNMENACPRLIRSCLYVTASCRQALCFMATFSPRCSSCACSTIYNRV